MIYPDKKPDLPRPDNDWCPEDDFSTAHFWGCVIAVIVVAVIAAMYGKPFLKWVLT